MKQTQIIVYGADWCGDCIRSKRLLDTHHVDYHWVDIEIDETAEQFVIKTNGGMRSIPTIVFSDGSILVEPPDHVLAKKLGIAPS